MFETGDNVIDKMMLPDCSILSDPPVPELEPEEFLLPASDSDDLLLLLDDLDSD